MSTPAKRLLNPGGFQMKTTDAGSEAVVGLLRSPRRWGVGFWMVLAIFAVCGFSCPHFVSAQAVYGSILGTVTDSTGAVVPNATVTVTNLAKGISAGVQSDASGEYRVQHLIPDTYNVTAEATGFSKVT